MADVKIQVSENSPYIVRGEIELTDGEGKPISVQKRVIALRRCGGSTKPFCDGTHSQIGFQGAIRAMEEAAAGDS